MTDVVMYTAAMALYLMSAVVCLRGVAATYDLPDWLVPLGLLATMALTGLVGWAGTLALSIAID